MKRPAIILFVVFSLALMIRIVSWSHHETLQGDEGIQILTAKHLVYYHDFPIGGEISALDKDNKFIMHNSPLGFYFLTTAFFAGLGTTQGYTFVFVILNLIQAYWLYDATKILFNKKAGFITLLLALFSPTLIHAATWPSQPINAMFFDTLSLFLFAHFVKSRRDRYFAGAVIASLFATQLYPPMYLLIPLKIFLYTYILPKTKKPLKVTVVTVLTAIAMFLPLLIIELKYDWINFSTLQKFFHSTSADTHTSPFIERLVSNLKQVVAYLDYQLVEQKYAFFPTLVTLLGSTGYFLKQKFHRRYFLALSVFTFVPIMILTVGIKIAYLPFERAYLYVVIPYLFVLCGALFSRLRNKIFTVVAFLIFIFLGSSSLFYLKPNGNISTAQMKKVSAKILADSASRKVDISGVDVIAISPNDIYGWETPIYWYWLEEIMRTKLVTIDFHTSKTMRYVANKAELVYIICHNTNQAFTPQKCLAAFEKRLNGKAIPHFYKPIDTIEFDRQFVYVMVPQDGE